jgi:exonuclease SbcC
MLPLEIKITGLYSYIEEQIIDFSELTNAGLFGIFGEIGSGKSSILDVMSFAIYKKTERLNVSGDNRYYNMMNLKCNHSSASFKFQAGKENTIFEIEFSLKRNTNDFEDVSLFNHSYFKLEGINKIPVEQSAVLNEIGILYDNFKRTIIIPQGKFKDFIELGDADRTKMLKELFNLHRFDLSSKVISLERNNTENLNNLQGQLETYELVNDEQIQILEDEFKEIINELARLDTISKTQSDLVKQLENLKMLVNQLIEKNTTFLKYQSQELLDKKKTDELKEFEKVSEVFKNLLSEISILKINLGANSLKIEKKVQQKSECDSQLATDNLKLEKVKEQILSINSEKEKVIDFQTLIDLKSELILLSNINSEKSFVLNSLSDVSKAFNNKIDQKKNLQNKVLEIDTNYFSESKLTSIDYWFKTLNGLNDIQNENYNKKSNIQKSIDNVDKQFDIVFESQFKSLSKNLKKGFSLLEFNHIINKITTEIAIQLKEKRDELTHLKVQEELVKFSNNLEEGKPCDLCGAIHHPNPLNKDFSVNYLKEVENEISNFENTEIEINELTQSIRLAFSNLENYEKELKSINSEIDIVEVRKKQHIEKQVDKQFSENEQEEFYAYFKKVDELHLQLKLDKIEIVSLEESILLDQNKKEKLDKDLNEWKNEIASTETKIEMYRKSLKQLIENDYQSFSVEDLINLRKDLQDKINTIESDYNSINNKIQDLKIANAGFITELKMSLEVGAEIERNLFNKNALFLEKLTKIGKTESEIQSILDLNLNVQEIRESIEKNREALNLLQGEIKILKDQINNRDFYEEQFLEEKNKLNEILVCFNKLTENKGRIESEIKDSKIKLTQKNELQKRLFEIELRAENLKTLKKMFSSNGFVNFMSIRYLHNIVELANIRFQKMTKQRFKLTLKGKDNDFYVIDYLNGGKERSIKSLGGGQTFQACLALALALSENIQKLAAIDQQFFFLDEGFGTLDKNALTLVFDTLKSLKNDNRVVGLISHVEELQQEMDVFLKIENHLEKGTIITTSWN